MSDIQNAIKLISAVLAIYKGTLQEHKEIQEALNLIKAAVESKEITNHKQ